MSEIWADSDSESLLTRAMREQWPDKYEIKGGAEDVRKARWYVEKLLDVLGE